MLYLAIKTIALTLILMGSTGFFVACKSGSKPIVTKVDSLSHVITGDSLGLSDAEKAALNDLKTPIIRWVLEQYDLKQAELKDDKAFEAYKKAVYIRLKADGSADWANLDNPKLIEKGKYLLSDDGSKLVYIRSVMGKTVHDTVEVSINPDRMVQRFKDRKDPNKIHTLIFSPNL